MNKLFAFGAMALSLALGAPAMAQMDHPNTMQGPRGTTVTRTEERPDGSRTVVRRTTPDEGQRTVVRRTVVRHTEGYGNPGWHRQHRRCVTRWHHHRRVTRCWTH